MGLCVLNCHVIFGDLQHSTEQCQGIHICTDRLVTTNARTFFSVKIFPSACTSAHKTLASAKTILIIISAAIKLANEYCVLGP